MKFSLIIVLAFLAKIAFSQAEERKVVYEYKKYEKFDLGDMEIKGSLIAPGDLSVKERQRKVFSRDLLNKTNFDQEMHKDINLLR